MNVFDSQLGHDFIRSLITYLPALTDAVVQLAAKSTAKVPAIELQNENPGILRDFYRGYYQPGEEAGITKTPAYMAYTEKLGGLEKELRSRINSEDWILVEQYSDLLVQRGCEELSIVFESGFQAATQLFAAGLSTSKGKMTDEM